MRKGIILAGGGGSFIEGRLGHDRRYAICADELSHELGFRAQTSPAKGLSLSVDWYLDNEEWWQSIRSGNYRQWIELQYGTAN
jgi:dTDP-glucose 4,6-dehydratase